MANPPNPYMTFKLTLPRSARSELILGRLYLQRNDKKQIEWVATSGLPFCQFNGSWLMTGRGCIPPNSVINEGIYVVEMDKLWYPNIPGIEGSSYKIRPDKVSFGLTSRGNFEIHFDANQPGTAGCIALTEQDGWNNFRETMKGLRDENIHAVPLNVMYTTT